MGRRSEMSLREKIGQLLMVGFDGTEASSSIVEMIENDKIGSLCLFPRNIDTPKQVLKLTSDLQNAAEKSGHPYPLLISIDQENGIVRRLRKGVTEFPGSMLLGAVGDFEATRAVSRATAEELKAVGVNMNLAPDLDVNNNPENPVIGVRSFGERPEDVAKHGVAFIEGHHDAGVMTSVKHFPGHGDTAIDSHLNLPTISHSMERLGQVELPPFIEAIKAGTDTVMTSHIYFSTLDTEEEIPASLSKAVTTGLLREKLGFHGVIVTDCLEMNAVVSTAGTVEGALIALKAGADLLLISHTYDLQKQALDRIEAAVNEGELPEEWIDRAVERVWELKKKYLSWETTPALKEIPSFVGGEAHEELSRKQYERGVTVVKNDGLLPLNVQENMKILVISVSGQSHTPVEGARKKDSILPAAIASHHANVLVEEVSSSPDEEEIARACKLANEADLIIFGTDNAFSLKRQVRIVKLLEEKNKPFVVVAVRNPYDLSRFPEVQAFITTYEPSALAVQAAADIIFGKIEPKGKLPVTIPQ